jgi:hypothetical protein
MPKQILFLIVACWWSLTEIVLAATPIIPVEEIRAGMQGYAKTVIYGDTIETFPVEVLGVTGNQDMGYQILIKASGSVIERSGGISQGMSGSPVYIDGRLAGAVAFGKAFTDSRYCFLQPIGNMLKLLDKPVAHYSGLLPKSTPLMAGGFTQQGLAYLEEQLMPFDLTALDVGGAGTTAAIRPLEPGSSVGVAVVDGDMTVGALGTVTWMDEEGHVLAFGHPFMQRGNAGYFMSKAWVLASVPNLQASYKVGTIGQTVGTINQDRAAGVAGKVGQEPAAIPMFVSVADTSRSLNGSARVRIVDDELLAPTLIGAVLVNEVSKVFDSAAGGSARVSFAIDALDAKGKPLTIRRENMFYNTANVPALLPEELQEAGKVLFQNKLEKVDVLGINVNVAIDGAARIAEIKNATVLEKSAAPGDTIHIKVGLQPYRGEQVHKTVTYKLPEDASGNLRLSVRGGAVLNWIQALLRQQKEAGVPALKKQKETPVSLKTYVDKINNADRNNDIIIDYARAGSAKSKAGKNAMSEEEAESMAEASSKATDFDALLSGSKHKQKTAMDFIVDGETTVGVKVKGAAKADEE